MTFVYILIFLALVGVFGNEIKKMVWDMAIIFCILFVLVLVAIVFYLGVHALFVAMGFASLTALI